eukprot:14817220-Alexandrium_andersonii.AAC.1
MARETQAAPFKATADTSRQALHQATPPQSAVGVCQATPTAPAPQQAQERGRSCRSAEDRRAVGPR